MDTSIKAGVIVEIEAPNGVSRYDRQCKASAHVHSDAQRPELEVKLEQSKFERILDELLAIEMAVRQAKPLKGQVRIKDHLGHSFTVLLRRRFTEIWIQAYFRKRLKKSRVLKLKIIFLIFSETLPTAVQKDDLSAHYNKFWIKIVFRPQSNRLTGL